MTRHQARPLWQNTRSEITVQSVRDYLVAVAWGAGIWALWVGKGWT